MFSRRDFLKAALVTAGGTLVGCKKSGDDSCPAFTTAGLQDGAAYFPQSVASGDPKPDSVILWTRVADGSASGDLEVWLQVATDDQFTTLLDLGAPAQSCDTKRFTAEAGFDHCVKVRLEGLDAATTYYYRFIYRAGGSNYTSRTGRTKTAPAPTADVPVRFAFVSCQDFNGKYYNTYQRLAQQEVDFVVHLGDYIYETTGDPLFQQTTPDRVTTFSDEAGAIVFHAGQADEFFAAKSISNYREIYQTVRGDQWLQLVHERYPMVCVWDDHEFSDDCYGATATYFDGAQDEHDVARRKAANQAWFEYMPVDYPGAPDFRYDPAANYPDDLSIYRDLQYGANLHLVLTDLRTYRPDHIIPEDLFPGAVLMDEATLTAAVGAPLPAWADYYVDDITTFSNGDYATFLTTDVGLPSSLVTGPMSVRYINGRVRSLSPAGLTEIDGATAAAGGPLSRGLTAVALGKLSLTSAVGSRYLVVKEPFDVWAGAQYTQSSGSSEDMLGATQENWFLTTIQGSSATWKIWGNEFMLLQKGVDLSPLTFLGEFAQQYLLSAEDWDGARNKRDELVQALAAVGNVVAITGDIHAIFAGNVLDRRDTTRRIVELVCPAISSGTYKTLLTNQALADPNLAAVGADALAQQAEAFLLSSQSQPNPGLAFANTDVHGFSVVDISATQLMCTTHYLDAQHVDSALTAAQLDTFFMEQRFRIDAGSPDLYVENGGVFQRWDPDTFSFV